MTAALRCDNQECAKLVTDPKDAADWWRLERNGEDVQGPGSGPGIGQLLATTMQLDISADMLGEAADGLNAAAEDVGAETDPSITEDQLPYLILHFCSASCLAAWAELAANLE